MTLATIETGLIFAAQKMSVFIIVLVPVLVFLAATAVSGIITYKIRIKRFRKDQDEKSDAEER